MEWSPPALMIRPTPQSGVRHCWFGSPAAKEMVWTPPSHLGSERQQERRSPRYTRRHQSAKVVVLRRPLRVRRARNEDYDIWRGPGKAGLCATSKSREFLFHRSRYDLMKPVVPSTVPYPDMRSR